MRVLFPNASVVKAAATRLLGFVERQYPDTRLNIDVARNVVSQCFGYRSFKDLQSNFSSAEPQLKNLSQYQNIALKEDQIRRLSERFVVSTKEATAFWMTMIPALDFNERYIKVGQVARRRHHWGRPDEYGEDTDDIYVHYFVIGVPCQRCGGVGKYENYEQEDLSAPPSISYDICDLCNGTGVYEHEDEILNRLRLSETQFHLKAEMDRYYAGLEDLATELLWAPPGSREDPYTGWPAGEDVEDHVHDWDEAD